jgi:lysophospholipase L1-like esterase
MRNFEAPTTFGSHPGRSTAPRMRRTGFVIALTLGLTGLLAGAAAPAGASTVTAGADQQAWPDGRGGEGRGGGDGRGWGGGHGDGRGHGHGRDRTVDYVAFGDSYASGYGGGPVLDACGRTAEGYPTLLDALPRVELDSFQACAGATALTTEPAPPAGPVDLPEQISAAVSADLLNRQTDLVTVTISGNDVQFGSVVAACLGDVLPETCAPAVAAAQSFAETAVVPQLQASFAAIREAAPRAELVVAGYPHLFDGTTPGALSIEAQNLFNAGTDALNAVVAQQVGDGTFVDVTEVFAGHGIGSADSWILPPDVQFGLHPTAAGYREGYLPAIVEAVDILNQNGAGHGHGGCRGRG